MGLLWIIVGVAFLWWGADALVRGASQVAMRLGVRPLVIGLTVVSLCTSMPEAAASFEAQLLGLDSIALGNILGSNIANVGLILGITALVIPLPISEVLRRREMPLMVAALWIFLVLMALGLGRVAGIILLALLVLYLALQVWWHPKNGQVQGRGGIWQIVVGSVALAGGGYILIQGALSLGLSQRVAGLTVVAIGTSLPELAATLIAALRGHPEIALGNVVGSNIFNVLFVGGGSALIHPIQFNPKMLWVDAEIMIFFSLLMWGLLWMSDRFHRLYGLALLCLYIIFIILV